jgi:pyrroloquinoline quinone biosynthesis protein B
LLVRVLGSAAGGGFPQWNCGCRNCSGLRSGTLRARARTQESVALSSDGRAWFLLNVSPEVRQQLESFSALHPRSLRDTPLSGVVLTNGDLDHCLGLLSLRESQRLTVYATEQVRSDFVDQNAFSRTLERFEGQITWRRVIPGVAEPLLGPDGAPSGLQLSALSLPGKPPLHTRRSGRSLEDNVGLRIEETRSGHVVAYASGVAGPSPALVELTRGASVVFFDGTFWENEELVGQGVGDRDAADMAHWPLAGEAGSLVFLQRLEVPRRILIHINNTNPLLDEDSAELELTTSLGVEVAYDGMELSL